MSKKLIRFKGKVLEDCSREELIKAIKILLEMEKRVREDHNQTLRMWKRFRETRSCKMSGSEMYAYDLCAFGAVTEGEVLK